MKKNTIIAVLAVLVVMFGLFAFAQKVKADQNAEEAIKQVQIAEEQRAAKIAAQEEGIVALIQAEAQKYIADVEHERADSLQQQLDKCK